MCAVQCMVCGQAVENSSSAVHGMQRNVRESACVCVCVCVWHVRVQAQGVLSVGRQSRNLHTNVRCYVILGKSSSSAVHGATECKGVAT